MNKARREELAVLKYKKRLKGMGLKPSENNLCFKSSGRPCSCSICKQPRYSKKDRTIKIDISADENCETL
jgi:hypothetical protein